MTPHDSLAMIGVAFCAVVVLWPLLHWVLEDIVELLNQRDRRRR